MQLQLLKIVDGCCKGKTRYHKYKQKLPATKSQSHDPTQEEPEEEDEY